MIKLKEFWRKSQIKPWDVIIIAGLILASFIPLVIFGQQKTAEESDSTAKTAILRIDGKEYKEFSLAPDLHYTYRYEDRDGDYNLIEIKDGRIRIKAADCGDQVCVRRGWADKTGETIVCLPHKLVIEVKNGGESDDLIY